MQRILFLIIVAITLTACANNIPINSTKVTTSIPSQAATFRVTATAPVIISTATLNMATQPAQTMEGFPVIEEQGFNVSMLATPEKLDSAHIADFFKKEFTDQVAKLVKVDAREDFPTGVIPLAKPVKFLSSASELQFYNEYGYNSIYDFSLTKEEEQIYLDPSKRPFKDYKTWRTPEGVFVNLIEVLNPDHSNGFYLT